MSESDWDVIRECVRLAKEARRSIDAPTTTPTISFVRCARVAQGQGPDRHPVPGHREADPCRNKRFFLILSARPWHGYDASTPTSPRRCGGCPAPFLHRVEVVDGPNHHTTRPCDNSVPRLV
jgi:hypothetical protein